MIASGVGGTNVLSAFALSERLTACTAISAELDTDSSGDGIGARTPRDRACASHVVDKQRAVTYAQSVQSLRSSCERHVAPCISADHDTCPTTIEHVL